jgi:WD40 repeat protein
MSAEGRTLLASASADAMVRIWDPATGELRQTLEGHTAGVWSVCAVASDGNTLLASCADDATLRVWEPGASQALHTIPVHLVPHVVTEFGGQLAIGLSAGLLSVQLEPDDSSWR